MPSRLLHYAVLDSPVGLLMVAGDGEAVNRVALQHGEEDFVRELKASGLNPRPGKEHLAPVLDALEAYFARGAPLEGIDPAPIVGTELQRDVWKALESIPHGQVRSYRWLAEAVGRPGAYRAVGAANGANPIPIVVPCHRVINADGRLGGYTGGLSVKRRLLEIEGLHVDNGGYVSPRSASSPRTKTLSTVDASSKG